MQNSAAKGSILVLLAFFCLPGRASNDDPLAVELVMDDGIHDHYVEVSNRSDEFLCVAEAVFDTRRAYITLYDEKHNLVRKRDHADPGPPIDYRGVNLLEPFFFLQPHRSRRFYLDLHVFAAEDGVYRYSIIVPYYRCSDIVVADDHAQKPLRGYSVQASGKVRVSNE